MKKILFFFLCMLSMTAAFAAEDYIAPYYTWGTGDTITETRLNGNNTAITGGLSGGSKAINVGKVLINSTAVIDSSRGLTAVNGTFAGSMQISGVTSMNNNIIVSGNATITGNLSVTGTQTFTGNLSGSNAVFSGKVTANEIIASINSSMATASVLVSTTGTITNLTATNVTASRLYVSGGINGGTASGAAAGSIKLEDTASGVTRGITIDNLSDSSGTEADINLRVGSGLSSARLYNSRNAAGALNIETNGSLALVINSSQVSSFNGQILGTSASFNSTVTASSVVADGVNVGAATGAGTGEIKTSGGLGVGTNMGTRRAQAEIRGQNSTTIGTNVDLWVEGGNSNTTYAQIGLGYHGGNDYNAPVIIAYDTTVDSGATKGDLVFYLRDDTNGTTIPAERLRIGSNGTVSANSIVTEIVTASSVVATNLTGTLQTAAQTNITSVGTLSNLNVSGTVTANSFRMATTTRNYSLSPWDFSPPTGNNWYYQNRFGRQWWKTTQINSDVKNLYGAIHLPDGCVIKTFQVGISCNAAEYVSFSIMKESLTSNAEAISIDNVIDASTDSDGWNIISTSNINETIDNSNYSYFITGYCFNNSGTDDIYFGAARIEYAIENPLP